MYVVDIQLNSDQRISDEMVNQHAAWLTHYFN